MRFNKLMMLLLLLISAVKLFPQEINNQKTVQAQIVLTVSESKRLIAKAVAKMPIIENALQNGMVIIARGTTNTYVAEEILGESIEHGAFVTGKTYPKKNAKRLQPSETFSEIILVNGKVDKEMEYTEAVTKLQAGDVMIKGGNALDYQNKLAGVCIGSPTGGTTGKFMPYVVARKAHLLIPIGLEKQVAGNLLDIQKLMREPMESEQNIPSMFLLSGQIVTEIEALQMLSGVTAFQVGAGGIGGAEGSVRLLVRGSSAQVNKALDIVGDIYGEPVFVE